jgi:hypothetical protein
VGGTDVAAGPTGFFQIGANVFEKVNAAAFVFARTDHFLNALFRIKCLTKTVFGVDTDGTDFVTVFANPISFVLDVDDLSGSAGKTDAQ